MVFRNICFTINNTHEIPSINLDKVQYYIIGKEYASTGTPHLQGYAELIGTHRLNAVKRIFGSNTMHIEKRRGTQDEAINYCKKDGDFVEHGIKKSGGRANIKEAAMDRLEMLKVQSN